MVIETETGEAGSLTQAAEGSEAGGAGSLTQAAEASDAGEG